MLKRGTRELRFRVPAALVARELERLDEARARSREQIQHIKDAHRRLGRRRARLPVRRAAADARRPDADRAGRGDHPRRAAQRRVGAAARAASEISALFDRGEDPYLRERKGDVADVVGRLCMNLRAGGRSDRSVPGPRRPAGARRRRAHAVGDRAARLAAARGARHRRRQLDLSHRDPRAVAAHSGRRRPAQRQRGDSAGAHARRRRRRPAR